MEKVQAYEVIQAYRHVHTKEIMYRVKTTYESGGIVYGSYSKDYILKQGFATEQELKDMEEECYEDLHS